MFYIVFEKFEPFDKIYYLNDVVSGNWRLKIEKFELFSVAQERRDVLLKSRKKYRKVTGILKKVEEYFD